MEDALEAAKEAQPVINRQITSKLSSLSRAQSDARPNPLVQLAKMRRNIRETRILRDEEESKDLRMVQKMIQIYKQLRAQRQRQGFNSTSVKVIFCG